jgi:hypothetical protein
LILAPEYIVLVLLKKLNHLLPSVGRCWARSEIAAILLARLAILSYCPPHHRFLNIFSMRPMPHWYHPITLFCRLCTYPHWSNNTNLALLLNLVPQSISEGWTFPDLRLAHEDIVRVILKKLNDLLPSVGRCPARSECRIKSNSLFGSKCQVLSWWD